MVFKCSTFIVLFVTSLFLSSLQVGHLQSPREVDFNEDFFFDGFSKDCQLPCWNGLEPEISETQDLLRLLDSLGWDGDIEESSLSSPYQKWFITQQFEFDGTADRPLRTGLTVAGVTEDEILRGLQIVWSNDGVASMSPMRILEAFGVPSEVYIVPDLMHGFVIWFAYEELNTHFLYLLFIEYSSPQELCFDTESWLYTGPLLSIFILNAEDEDLRSATLETGFALHDFVSISEITNMDIDHLTDLILESDNPCIEVEDEFLFK